MKHTFFILAFAAIAAISACDRSAAFTRQGAEEPRPPCENLLTLPVLYHQTSAEYRALCYQAFNMARIMLDMDLRRAGLSMQQAIVADIDETLLDNSPYEALCVKDGVSYPLNWKEWMESASAEPVPGALDFLKYAGSKGIEVFYVTNRKEMYREPTLNNMKSLGFPFADEDHLLMRTEENSKKARREKVAGNHRIIMFIGDNLADFSETFEGKAVEERKTLVDENKDRFGTLFIALPNVMYGDWKDAIYGYSKELQTEEMQEARRGWLKGF
ncbi:MAG: 5'-nucleotidase, lipoprotein e(P4) family [Bacteroidales bacterium]|nr:5'-nucleotidase, lipoprotein e(P4) family [Bacteroidales bacterium]